MSKSKRYPPEVRARALSLGPEHQEECGSQWEAIGSVAAKIGRTAETLQEWMRQTERDEGLRAGVTSDVRERLEALERENRELRRASEISCRTSASLVLAELRPLRQTMIAFIDARCEAYGVESICDVSPIAPSTYYENEARARDPECQPARACRDTELRRELERVHRENVSVYGSRKVWCPLDQERIRVARCTSRRLMHELGLRGEVRGRRVRTVHAGPEDLVQRTFRAERPNALCVSDLSCVATWRGFVDVAFLSDASARRIVGWYVWNSLRTDLALDALDQALYERDVAASALLVHHSDRGAQYFAIRYTERLAGAGVEPSVGSVGDWYDNALVATVIGRHKAEVIRKRGPGAVWTPSSSQRSSGSTASISDACSNRSVMCRQRRSSRRAMTASESWARRPDSKKRVSGILSAVHTSAGE